MTLRIFNPDDPQQPKPAKPPFAVCARCTHYDGRGAAFRAQLCTHPDLAYKPAVHPQTGEKCYTDGVGFFFFTHPLADAVNPRGECEKFSPGAIE